MTFTKTIEGNGLKIVIRRRTYGDKLRRVNMTRRFMDRLPDDASDDDADLFTARLNFIYASAQSEVVEGDFDLPNPSFTRKHFEKAFDRLLNLDETFVDQWMEAIGDVQEGVQETSDPLPSGA